MNGFKKICSFIIVIFLALGLIIKSPIMVQAVGNNGNKIDAVFVLDSSNSMKKSDPQNIRQDAFKLFVDMCHMSGDGIGLVAFGDKLARDIKPVTIVDQSTKEELKKKVEGIPLSDYTDIGLGLKRAVEGISKDSNNIPLIVLLSDGKNDPARSKEESERDISSAIEYAKQNGQPIYTIGLNVNGSVDQELLTRISNETKGRSFIINNAEKLPSIFGEIFAERSKLKMINGGTLSFNGDYQNVNIDMPDENVVEGNIAIMSDGIEDIKVFDTTGAEQPLNSDKIYFIKSQNYSLVKFINPQSKNWILKIKGVAGKQGIFNCVYNYNLELAAKFSPNTGIKVGDTVKINAVLMSNGKSITSSEFYSGLTGKLIITDNKTGQSKDVKLNNTGSGFEGEYQFSEKGDYELKVRVDGNSLYRESDPLKIDFEKAAPVQPANNLSKLDIKGLMEKYRDYWMYMAGGAGLLLLLIIMAIAKSIKKESKRKKRKAAKKQTQNGVEQAADGEITLGKEAVTVSEAAASKEAEIKKEETKIPEVPLKAEGQVKEKAVKKEERTKAESKIAGGEFAGSIMITIKDRDTDTISHPLFKNLMEYKNSISLSQLLSELPEFKETQKINFYPGVNGSLVIKNLSNALVEKNHISIGSAEVVIKNEEKINIILNRVPKTIYIQYFIR